MWTLKFYTSLDDLALQSGSHGEEAGRICAFVVVVVVAVKWHEETKHFAMSDCVRDMTAKKLCKYSEFSSFALPCQLSITKSFR